MANNTERTAISLRHLCHYGKASVDDPSFSGPIPTSFTFNSPIGLAMDRLHQVWVCDTGNNRIVVLDHDFRHIRRILAAPATRGDEAATLPFHMPFHLCPHPEKPEMFITDMGNRRVVVMRYGADGFEFVRAFGNTPQAGFDGLADPNGITLVRQADDSYHVFVNDEFHHTPEDPRRNRCVRFDENGRYVSQFCSLIDPSGEKHDLYWPQGLSSDQAGNLYIANTGSYEILKCPSNAPIDAKLCIAADLPVVPHPLGQQGGIGMLNIMRFVSVIGERIFVPDHIANSISVLDPDKGSKSLIAGTRPAWNHRNQPIDSPSDPLYYALEDMTLTGPYAICQGEAADIYFISEPFTSRVSKLRISGLDQPIADARLLCGVGGRRDEPGKKGGDPQFNCVTSVISLSSASVHPQENGAEAPFFEQPATPYPWQRWLMNASALVTRQYEYWFAPLTRSLLQSSQQERGLAPGTPECLNLDAGNWGIRSYAPEGDDYRPIPSRVNGYFLPGNLAMTAYHPRRPLLGQICPGTPLLLVSNFNLGTVSLYQQGPLGDLVNYGLPFGLPGSGEGCLLGPQGLAASADGDIYVVDALNHRIAQWQLLQTGQALFVRNFSWPQTGGGFTPTDIALDASGRLFVTDQFNNRICVFDRQGHPLWCQGEAGYWEEGEPHGDRFMLPTSLTIEGSHLIVNDLVNRALKVFEIGSQALHFKSGISLFKRTLDQGGVWMPFFMHAHQRRLFVADSTFNLVQVYAY